jgi:serine/arginine repetitive matrix protein 2
MLHSVEAFAVQPDEDLEIVDFSDMGKFVAIADPPLLQEGEPAVENQSSRSSRHVAADFFSEKSSTRDIVTSTSDTGPWRRKQSRDFDREPPTPGPMLKDQSQSVTSPSNAEQLVDTTPVQPHGRPEATLDSSTRDKSTSHDPTSVASSSRMASTLPLTNSQRPPRSTPAFREAAMSTLDDAMSRIKGALDGMQQTTEISKEPGDTINGEVEDQPVAARSKIPLMSASQVLLRESSRVPSVLRPHNHEFDQQYQEVFDITMSEPPRSPKPAWDAFIVRLPRTAQLLEPLTRRQYHLHKSPPGQVRWDILSFNPPVEGMNRRDFSLNDVLFRKPPHMAKTKRRYVVSLPKAVHFRREISGSSSATTPKIRVPSSPVAPRVNGVGAFGRPGGAIDSSTWRKSAAPPSMKTSIASTDLGLNTISRSPPPNLVSNPSKTAPTKVDESASARSRSQPKMPAGSAVAFYRDSRVDSLESAQKSSVNFTVTSELEDALHSKSKAGPTMLLPAASPSVKVANALPSAGEHITSVVSELKSQPTSPDLAPTLVQSKADNKSSEDSVRSVIF